MGLPPVLVYQPVNEPGKPSRRGFRNLFAEQDAPCAGQRRKQLCGHRQEYSHQPQIEPPELVVIAANRPSVFVVDLLEGRGDMLLIGQQEVRQLMVDMPAALTAIPMDHQYRRFPIVPDEMPPAGADGVKPPPVEGTGVRRGSAPHIKRSFSPSSIQ